MKLHLPGADLEDTTQVIIGASAVAVPVAFTEEAWQMGDNLPYLNLMLLIVLSLGFCGLYAYSGIYQSNVESKAKIFLARTFLDYLLSSLVVIIILVALNRFPLSDDPAVALQRVIVISFPASLGAVLVDGIDKE